MRALHRIVSVLVFVVAGATARGQSTAGTVGGGQGPGGRPDVGVQEKVGSVMPMDTLLRDEEGNPIRLRDVVDRPTLLVFVYYRCPAICDPLLREIARNLDQMDLRMGEDYRVVTISFDAAETPDLARSKKGEILATLSRRPPDDGWRFLTADEVPIRVLTEAAGFGFRWNEDSQTFVHASSLIFLTREGRIARYLGGLTFVPSEIKMALLDAKEGRERSFMEKVAGICYGFDPESRTYVLRINRLILVVTGLVVLAFVAYLAFGRGRHRKGSDHA